MKIIESVKNMNDSLTLQFLKSFKDFIEEIRLNLKEFHVTYKGTEFNIFDASPMFRDNNSVMLKCKAVS